MPLPRARSWRTTCNSRLLRRTSASCSTSARLVSARWHRYAVVRRESNSKMNKPRNERSHAVAPAKSARTAHRRGSLDKREPTEMPHWLGPKQAAARSAGTHQPFKRNLAVEARADSLVLPKMAAPCRWPRRAVRAPSNEPRDSVSGHRCVDRDFPFAPTAHRKPARGASVRAIQTFDSSTIRRVSDPRPRRRAAATANASPAAKSQAQID